MLKPKVGDLVRLKPLLVSGVYDYYFTTPRSPLPHEFNIYSDLIEEILPRPLTVGDRVKHLRANECKGTVVAIVESDAFIDWDATPYALRGTALNARERISELAPA